MAVKTTLPLHTYILFRGGFYRDLCLYLNLPLDTYILFSRGFYRDLYLN